MASSRMGSRQTTQLYEQDVQTGEPSDRTSKLVSDDNGFPHFAQLKLNRHEAISLHGEAEEKSEDIPLHVP